MDIAETYNDFTWCYTDASVTEENSKIAIVLENYTFASQLPKHISPSRVEAEAILKYLQIAEQTENGNIVICIDSQRTIERSRTQVTIV